MKMASEQARNAILSCRGKLSPNTNSTLVWINEDYPDAYKRRKIMLRDLVKHINNLKGHSAAIESGRLRLDGKYYGPDQFSDLPYNCQPHNVQVIFTDHNTTLFAGEWAFLSNMYPCSVVYEGIKFTSSEQCYQFVRARSNNDLIKAHRIITNNDPFACKRTGDSIDHNPDWDNRCETVMTVIIRLKFNQNQSLYDSLLATGDRVLQEATSSSIWGIGARLKSKAARENTATGDNLLGKILMSIRSSLLNDDRSAESDNSPCPSESDVNIVD